MTYIMKSAALALATALTFFSSIPVVVSTEYNTQSFEQLNHANEWLLKLNDSGTDDWQKHWFLDGRIATVKNSEQGMVFSAGAMANNDAHHGVLWTKESFSGDIKVEYLFTKLDDEMTMVNILYILATGVPPHDRDISIWQAERQIPAMNIYFNQMKSFHISYAAFKKTNDDLSADYIRARAYPRQAKGKFSATQIPPSFDSTGLFHTGKTYKITAIKADNRLYFNVEADGEQRLFSWDITAQQGITVGRVGLRHMYTRSSRYQNFRIYTKPTR